MKDLLQKLYHHQTLESTEAFDLLKAIADGTLNPEQTVSVMTILVMRPVKTEELLGFQKALLEMAIPFDTSGRQTIDVCGTGGDGKNSFNISTLAAFVIAGAGYKVVKHGNYGVSSLCGSSNVLEQMGISFTNDTNKLNQCLNESNICFLHAPLFHPAMKAVAPLRRALGIRTFFNMLGPLVNPAEPSHQLTGVYDLTLARQYNAIQSMHGRHYSIVHSLDGFDEISLTSPVKFYSDKGEGTLHPHDFGFKPCSEESISGGNTLEEAGNIFRNVLTGKGSKAQQNVVLANAATAIKCMEPEWNLQECMACAREALLSGKAMKSLEKMRALN